MPISAATGMKPFLTTLAVLLFTGLGGCTNVDSTYCEFLIPGTAASFPAKDFDGIAGRLREFAKREGYSCANDRSVDGPRQSPGFECEKTLEKTDLGLTSRNSHLRVLPPWTRDDDKAHVRISAHVDIYYFGTAPWSPSHEDFLKLSEKFVATVKPGGTPREAACKVTLFTR